MKTTHKLISALMFAGIATSTNAIAQAHTADYIGKWSSAFGQYVNTVTPIFEDATNSRIGIGTTSPYSALHVMGVNAAPASTVPATGDLFVGTSITNLALTMGVYNNGSGTVYSWMQSRDQAVASTYEPLNINPLGGNVGIGMTNPQRKLVVSNSGAEGMEINPFTGYCQMIAYKRSTSTWIPLVLQDGAGGNVGIGTTSPQQKLVVSNNGSEGIEMKPTSGYTQISSYNRGSSAYVPLVLQDPSGNGGVGIGLSSLTGRFHVYNPGSTPYARAAMFEMSGTTATQSYWAVDAEITASTGSPNNMALYGNAQGNCNSDAAFGAYGEAENASTNYGIYGTTATDGCPTATNYAAYFSGNVVYTGTLTHVSDQKFKENIVPIDNALSVIKALTPHKYNYTKNAIYKSMNFSEGEQYGFIAQEIEKIIPGVVTNNTHPAQYDKKGNKISDAIKYKGVDYVSLIPFIVGAMNEQQTMIEDKNKKIDALQKKVDQQSADMDDLKKQVKSLIAVNTIATPGQLNSANSVSAVDVNLKDGQTVVLDQNVPNPFAEKTVINYFLPDNTGKAQILFYNSTGRLIQTIDLIQKGQGSVNVFASDLTNGLYTYSLVVDGKIMDSKKMVKQ